MQTKKPLRSSWLVLACVLAASHAQASGVVLEIHTRERAADATALFAPIYDELEQRGYSGRAALARHYERRVSRAADGSRELGPDFIAEVERGHRAAMAGHFEEAVAILAPLVETAQSHSIAIAASPLLRESLLKALLGLALSHQRGGDLAAAKTALLEMMRTYPDTTVARAAYGPELNALYEDVRRAVGRGARGALRLEVGANVVVFMNERFVSLGATTHRELVPGVYRVFAQLSKSQTSRVHSVEVKAGQETVVTIDAPFEDALRTSAEWTGLVFGAARERDEHDLAFAARLARGADATSAVLLTVDASRGARTVTGTLLDVAQARELRRASVVVAPGSDDRLRALAVFLAGGEPADGLDVEVDSEPAAPPPAPHASHHRWLRWAGIGGVALGVAVGGGLALSYRSDARAAAAELDRVCSIACSPADVRRLDVAETDANHHASLALAAGGAVVVTGVVLLVMDRLDRDEPRSSDSSPSIAVSPIAGGAIGFYATTF